MKKFNNAVIVILLFSLFVSCIESIAPVLTGNISGFIYLYEEDNTQITDRSGVKVSIEGRSNYAVTNKDGKYTIENVEAGIFNIVYEKEGFGLYKIIAREFVGGGDAYIYTTTLMKLPSFNITSLNITKATGSLPYLRMSGNLSDARSYTRNVIFFFGKTESVSNDPNNYLMTVSANAYQDSSSYSGFIWDKEYLLQSGFNLGETVHVAAYSQSGYGWGTLDPVTGRYFYYNVGSSPVKSSFILD